MERKGTKRGRQCEEGKTLAREKDEDGGRRVLVIKIYTSIAHVWISLTHKLIS